MTIYHHEKLRGHPNSLPIPGATTLGCSIYSSETAATVAVTYSIEPGNRYWFDVEGSRVKRFTVAAVTVGSSPTPVVRPVTITRESEGTDPLFFYVTASIVEDGTGSRVRTAEAITPA